MTMEHPVTAGERGERGAGRRPAVPVALQEVRKVYRHGQSAVRALDGVSAEFARHSFTAVMGPSGSGTASAQNSARSCRCSGPRTSHPCPPADSP